jgi:glycosyltransferase involved in cell wall biosynthesis
MIPEPSECRDREPTGIQDEAICHFLLRAMGLLDPRHGIIRRDVCMACCRTLRGPGQMNPVVASLIYQLGLRIQRIGGFEDCSSRRAETLVRYATDHLHTSVGDEEQSIFPPTRSAPVSEWRPRAAEKFRWAIAMLTAPRGKPTIEATLASLRRAGFGEIRLFAEPGSLLPVGDRELHITVRPGRFGNLLNFYAALATLCEKEPRADAYAVFQDDIEVATGLREWCEGQLWPQDSGLVSLFTPRLHADHYVGWRILSPGVQRVCGAQAIVWRRDLLEQFLSDAQVVRELGLRRWGDDAVLGAWMARTGLGMAYHTPSPVQHIGEVSALYPGGPDRRNIASAVQDVARFSEWTCRHEPGTIGLVGWNTATGLGTINRDLVRLLGIRHWLCPPHPMLAPVREHHRRDMEITRDVSPSAVRQWVQQLDWLLFAEQPYLDFLPQLAAHAGVGIACIPMWELIRPTDPWLQFVDVMICPTRHTERLMNDWRCRYGFGWKTIRVSWPIDTRRFPMRERQVCREFLFVNGWGGGHARYLDGSPFPYSRKGLEVILDAACLAPDLKFIVRSLAQTPSRLPPNVRLAPAVQDHSALYDRGDVCIQPSHYEGLGLQLLECQAAGMPLITTAAPPMNEVQPWQVIPCDARRSFICGAIFLPPPA